MLSSLGFKMQTKNSTSSYLFAGDLVFSKSKLPLLVKFHVWVHIATQAGAGLPYASFGRISAFLVCMTSFGSLRNRAGKWVKSLILIDADVQSSFFSSCSLACLLSSTLLCLSTSLLWLWLYSGSEMPSLSWVGVWVLCSESVFSLSHIRLTSGFSLPGLTSRIKKQFFKLLRRMPFVGAIVSIWTAFCAIIPGPCFCCVSEKIHFFTSSLSCH